MATTTRRSWGKLRKIGSGRYQASYVYDGIRYTSPNTYDARIDGEGWLASERKLIDLGAWQPPADRIAAKKAAGVTVCQYANGLMELRKATGDHSPKTVQLNRELLDGRILPDLGDRILGELAVGDIEGWWIALTARKATPTRNRHAYQLLSAICNAAVDDKVLLVNPCQLKAARKAQKPREVEALSVAELDKVAESIPIEYRTALYILAWCGLRFGELIELRRKDVHVLNSKTVIKVRRQATWVGSRLEVLPPKTDAGIRDVVVPPHVAAMLADHMGSHTGKGAEAFIFRTTRGQRLSKTAFTKTYKAGLEQVGKPTMHVHDLRHVGATWAAIAGATTKELMSRIGHATPNMAMRYQIASADRDAAIAAQMSKLAGP